MVAAGEVLFADVLLLPNGMSKVGFVIGWRTVLFLLSPPVIRPFLLFSRIPCLAFDGWLG